jgi:hypothetical protein
VTQIICPENIPGGLATERRGGKQIFSFLWLATKELKDRGAAELQPKEFNHG